MSKPREFWIERTPIDHFTHVALSVLPPGFTKDQLNEIIHVREVNNDEIRVNREDWEGIKARMEYTNSYPRKSCADFLERIERESK